MLDHLTIKPQSPKTRCNGTMTESAYLAWIRSALRSKSLRWPPRATALELARRQYKGENKQQKWEYKCAICKKWFKAKEVVVDHHPEAAGSILKFEDIGQFCNNLYCEVDNLRVLCCDDHATHTLAEKQNISFEEAVIQKKVIAIMKLSVKEQLDILSKLEYNVINVKNAKQRKEALIEMFSKG